MTATMIRLMAIFAGLAGLMGAAGTALWAAGSHGGDPAATARLTLAGQFLLIHGAAIIACAGWSLSWPDRGRLCSWLGLAACAGLVFGACLFAADLVWRAWVGGRLFALAAPVGGLATVTGWLLIAAAGVAGAAQKKNSCRKSTLMLCNGGAPALPL